MRIGVLTTSYPRTDEDPAGAFVAGFAGWLAANVGEVEVLCADERRPLFYRGGAPQALRRAGGWLGAAAFSSRLWSEARAAARGWDAIVSHWLVPCGAVGMALAGQRPHLAIAHGSDVRLLERLPGGRAFVRSLARRSDLVYVADALRVSGAAGRVVPMGIDCSSLAPLSGEREQTRRALGLDGFVVLFVGRLVREKGADLAIDALPEGATLLVAGDGPERRPELGRRAGPRVRFVGEVRGGAKRALFAAADALVVPSRTDGAPTVVLEGLAAGLPIVATRAGGIPELVSDGETALLCAPTSSALRSALVRLLGDSALRQRLARAARAAAAAHDWRVVGPSLAGSRLEFRRTQACNPCTVLTRRI